MRNVASLSLLLVILVTLAASQPPTVAVTPWFPMQPQGP